MRKSRDRGICKDLMERGILIESNMRDISLGSYSLRENRLEQVKDSGRHVSLQMGFAISVEIRNVRNPRFLYKSIGKDVRIHRGARSRV